MDQQPIPNQTPANMPGPKKGILGPVIGLIALAAIGLGYLFFSKKTQSGNQMQSEEGNAPGASEESMPDAEESEGVMPGPEAVEPAPAPTPAPMPSTPPPSAPETHEPSAAADYKNGTYAAVGNYISPGGPEQVGVTLTLENDIITNAQFEIKAFRPISKDKQTIFSQNYQPQVVGKDIDEVDVTKVSSSSLTPKGFMDAVNQIKAQAKG